MITSFSLPSWRTTTAAYRTPLALAYQPRWPGEFGGSDVPHPDLLDIRRVNVEQ